MGSWVRPQLQGFGNEKSSQELFNIIQHQVNISGDTTKQFCRGEAASGNHGAPVEAGAVLQGTGGSIPISISATPLLLRCLPGFLLSRCQLGSADRSELLPARTNRKA